MYHRFHAPCDARVREVVYVSGDTWNVNPIALKRIERLYCKNERAHHRSRSRPAGRPDARARRGDTRREHPPALPTGAR